MLFVWTALCILGSLAFLSGQRRYITETVHTPFTVSESTCGKSARFGERPGSEGSLALHLT